MDNCCKSDAALLAATLEITDISSILSVQNIMLYLSCYFSVVVTLSQSDVTTSISIKHSKG